MPRSRLASAWVASGVSFALLTSACTTFHMTEQYAPAAVLKHRRASEETAVVLPFLFVPASKGDQGDMTPQDLARWQELLAQGLDQADIFARIVTAGSAQAPARYAISGEIHDFSFAKNWVPTFFPIHLGASFFTFSLFTFLGGPTTLTKVNFDVTVDVKDVSTGESLGSFRKGFASTDVHNLYTKSTKNPYDNPTLVWNDVIGNLATEISAALPPDVAPVPATAAAPATTAPAAAATTPAVAAPEAPAAPPVAQPVPSEEASSTR